MLLDTNIVIRGSPVGLPYWVSSASTMPAKRNAATKESPSTADPGVVAMAMGEGRSPSAEVKSWHPFVIRNSALGIRIVRHSSFGFPHSPLLALRGFESDFGPEHADAFRRDRPPDLSADYVLANGSKSANQSGESDIRRALIEADLVDCTVALPGQLFYSTHC